MYKIYDMKTEKYLNGTSGHIKWTTEANARVFKRKEDVRNFLHFVKDVPKEWYVLRYHGLVIGTKSAQWVEIEGIV